LDIKLSLRISSAGASSAPPTTDPGLEQLAKRGRNSGTGGSHGAGRNGGAETIDFGPLEDWIGFNLRMAQDASFQAFSRRSQEIGMRPGRFATLTLIGRNPDISQTALSRANSRDKSTLTPLIADLVRRGLIRRTRTRNDRRSYRLTLTKAGEQVLAQLTACAREHERRLDAVIGARERAQFLRTLRKVAAKM
jgi:DNA-binding MarR family transcriptional regulator